MEIKTWLQIKETRVQSSTTVHPVTVEARFWPCGVHVQTLKKKKILVERSTFARKSEGNLRRQTHLSLK